MIIDCHTHIWPGRSHLGAGVDFACLGARQNDQALPHEHVEAGAQADFALTLGFTSRYLQAEIPNEYLADYQRAHSGRLAAFAGIDPTDKDARSQVQRLAREKRFAGFTLSPACQNLHPCDSRIQPLYEIAQDAGLPIYFLQGDLLPAAAPLIFAQPCLLDEVARDYPRLKLVISHLGYPWHEQTFALLAKHEHVFTDVAGLTRRPWQAYRTLTLAFEYGVMDKLLFASDFPNHSVKATIETLYNLNKVTLDSVLPAVPREHLRGIVERDSLALLGITPAADKMPASAHLYT